jgi:hypothetical protein
LTWKQYVLPLTAAASLVWGASCWAADGPKPSAEPLWKAYPLTADQSVPTAAKRPQRDPRTSTEPPAPKPTTLSAGSRGPAVDHPHASAPPAAIGLAFFASLALVVVLGGALALRRTVRGRRARNLAATALRFDRATPRLTDEDVAAREAYAELVRDLEHLGHTDSDSTTTTGARHG